MDSERYTINARVLEHHTLPVTYNDLPIEQRKYFDYVREYEKYELRFIAYRHGEYVDWLDVNDMEDRVPKELQGWANDWISTSFFDGIAIVDHYWNSDDREWWNDECEEDECYSVIHMST